MSHTTTDKVKNLGNWKTNGKVDVWVHTSALPHIRWSHGAIPKMVTIEDRGTHEVENRVWFTKWVCHEQENVLKVQNKRESGMRVLPPEHCAICRMLETVREMVTSGRLDWLTPIFKFEGDRPAETTILHAGGIWMSRKDSEELESTQVKRARDAGIRTDELWKENAQANADYVFRVVDDSAPDAGVQIAEVPVTLGDSFKMMIMDRRRQRRKDDSKDFGDPFKDPYAMEWIYNKAGKPADKYRAVAMPNLELTPAIQAAIYGEAPDIARLVTPFNIQEMRGYLEANCLIDLPWDEIFTLKERTAPQTHVAAKPTTAPAAKAAPREQEPEPRPSRAVKAQPAARAPFPSDDDEKAVECEACGKAMWDDAPDCTRCGAKYTASGKLIPKVVEPPPAPRSMRKRGEVVPQTSTTASAPATRVEAPAQRPKVPTPVPVQTTMRQPGDDTDDFNQALNDDDIPF